MSFVDVVLAIRRRWVVFGLVLAVAGAGFVVLDARGGVYSSKPVIQFMLPGAGVLEPFNGLQDSDLIGFAQTVAAAVNNGRPVERYALDEAPLYGAGLRQEVRVGVPSTGGQWGTSFNRAEIAISIVGTSREWVETTQEDLIERVLESASANQDMIAAPATPRFSYSVLPASTTIERVSSSLSTRVLALAAIMAAGTIVGGWCAVVVDRLAGRMLRARRGRTIEATEGGEAR